MTRAERFKTLRMLLFRSKDSVILGTLHLLPEWQSVELSGVIPGLVQNSARLILECEFSRPGAEPPGARLDRNVRLEDIVPADLYSETVQAAQRLGIEVDDLSTCSPWWLAERLETCSIDALQLRPEFSAEVMARRLARMSRKEIRFLEARERGYRCRSQAPLREQLWALEREVRRGPESEAELRQMVEAFASGSLPAWERFLTKSAENQPQTTDCMFRQRNEEWLPTLNYEFLRGRAFVIVGALHLVGDGGLLSLLRKSGRAFER